MKTLLSFLLCASVVSAEQILQVAITQDTWIAAGEGDHGLDTRLQSQVTPPQQIVMRLQEQIGQWAYWQQINRAYILVQNRGYLSAGGGGINNTCIVSRITGQHTNWDDLWTWGDFGGLLTAGGGDLEPDSVVGVQVLMGDANWDGIVDQLDSDILNANAFQPGGWIDGDFNADGFVDGSDFNILVNHAFEEIPTSPADFLGIDITDWLVDEWAQGALQNGFCIEPMFGFWDLVSSEHPTLPKPILYVHYEVLP